MYFEDATKEINNLFNILPAYKKALKHQLYLRYMDNPAEFKEISQLLDAVYDTTLENYQRVQSFQLDS